MAFHHVDVYTDVNGFHMKHPILTEFPQIKHFGAELFFLQLHMNFMIQNYYRLRESFKRPILYRQNATRSLTETYIKPAKISVKP